MDKNFIRIDDLVRQRMGGGEENERSGAWLNMRDLLDKEMPQQRRIGIFYWRRLFGVVAALSLIGTVCVGSYELSSIYKSRYTADNTTALVTAPTTANNESNINYELPANDVTPNNNSNNNTNNNNPAIVANTSTKENDGATNNNRPNAADENTSKRYDVNVNVNSGKSSIIDNPIAVDGKAKRKANNNLNTRANTAKKQAGKEIASSDAGYVTKTATEKRIANSNGGNEQLATTTATGTNVNNRKHGDNKTNGNTAAGTVAEETTGNSSNSNVQLTTKVATGNTSGAVAMNKPAGSNNTANSNATNSNTNVVTAANQPGTSNNATTGASNNAIGGAIASVDNHNKNNAGIAPADKNDDGMVLNSSAPSVKNAPVADAAKTAENAKVANHAANTVAASTTTPAKANQANTNSKIAAAEVAAKNGNVATKTKAAKPVAMTGGKISKAGDNNTGVAEKAQANNYTTGGGAPKNANSEAVNNYNKKVITKVLLHERLVKTGEDKNDYIHKLDTISIDRINMGHDEEEATADNVNEAEAKKPSAPTAKKSRSGHGKRGGNTSANSTASGTNNYGSGAGTANKSQEGAATASTTPVGAHTSSAAKNANEGEAANEEEIVPAASASNPTAASAEGVHTEATDTKTKTTTTAKKGSGMSLVKKLSLAFNDVKTNASNSRFEPGIIAGINSNFFGTTSFKGFQFGVTGNFIFNDTWNLMAELKYFHRLNNNTSIEDNYYTYTQVGAQYRKDRMLNSYDFSTLHSLEMPVAIRYAKGNFNFFTGGNFLYSLSINTGASTIPDYNTPSEMVSTPGTDNAPTYNETDFKNRFGLGYLLGFSYQVAPSVNIDLRSVQTVWDNAATTGAKSISQQLYKSPSLQLSIMYRLGGNRNKD